MEQEHGFVVVKEHYTEENIRQIQCFCLKKEKAEEEQKRIQNEISLNPLISPYKWKVTIEPFVIKNEEIVIIEPAKGIETNCKCGEEAYYWLFIHGHKICLCEQCIGELGKSVIDSLM